MLLLSFLLVLFAGPLAMLVAGGVMGADWRTANRESSGLAPDPARTGEAVIQVYAARTFGWRGAFAVHSWIATKERDAADYTVYQVVGWRHYRGYPSLSIGPDTPDRHWFGARPMLLAHFQGAEAERLIGKIDNAARAYPFAEQYVMWPGPNSNSFTAWVARQVPELQLELPPTAIGKDYFGLHPLDRAASGTGWQFSLFGLLGLTLAREEGLEINIAGLVLGIDPMDFSLKLPGVGRLGPRRDVVTRRVPDPA